jgi:hypothetical protein
VSDVVSRAKGPRPLALALCLLTFGLAVPARADSADEFKALMRKGITEYRNGNLEDARQALARAWTLRQENELAATLAEVEMKLGRFRDAAQHWEHYIQTLPPDRTEAEQRLSECRRRLGSVRVAAEPDGASVFVDGREVGRAPLRSDVWLDPGEHTFESRIDGRVSPMRRLAIGPGDALVITLEVGPGTTSAGVPGSGRKGAGAPGGAPAVAPGPEVDRGSGGLSGGAVVLIAGSVLTATATGLGVGFTLKAGGADDDVTRLRQRIATQPGAGDHSYCSPPSGTPLPTECGDLVDKLDERDSSRRIALGSFIAGGVLGVGTVVTYLLWPSRSAADAGSPPVAVLPFAAGPGASLRLRF